MWLHWSEESKWVGDGEGRLSPFLQGGTRGLPQICYPPPDEAGARVLASPRMFVSFPDQISGNHGGGGGYVFFTLHSHITQVMRCIYAFWSFWILTHPIGRPSVLINFNMPDIWQCFVSRADFGNPCVGISFILHAFDTHTVDVTWISTYLIGQP